MEAKSCLHNAERCIEIARQSGDVKLQSILFDLTRVWLELGIACEKRRGLAWLNVPEVVTIRLFRLLRPAVCPPDAPERNT